MTRRVARARAYAPDPAAPVRSCDITVCPAAGEYRAPNSRRSLRDYWWFCREHVRAYNLSWDYYKGMSPGQIEAELRADLSWQRPTWPLGQGAQGGTASARGNERRAEEVLRDPLGALGARLREAQGREAAAPAELRGPLALFDLGWPTTLKDVKQRYKQLAKRHHPDANGGDPAAAEQFKRISHAYATLRGHLAAGALAAAE